MRTYLDHMLRKFYAATNWNEDNLYSNVTVTSQDLLEFPVPRGVTLNVSALSSPVSASSYSLRNLGGLVDGTISYFYCYTGESSTGNDVPATDLKAALSGYRLFGPLKPPDEPWMREVIQGGRRVDHKNTMLFGKVYLPGNMLEALYVRQLSPTKQLVVAGVSGSQLRNGGTVMAQYQTNVGQWCNELIYNTHEALLGFRGLYNVGYEARVANPAITSRFSVGAEVFYSALSKSGGVSTAMRYTNTASYTGSPLTMTLTTNPVMGHISATYAVRASADTALASRYDFNFYSYTSNLTVGCELWRRQQRHIEPVATESDSEPVDVDVAIDEAASAEPAALPAPAVRPLTGVIKASLSTNNLGLRLLWEGRAKDFLYSVGATADLRRPALQSFGIELQYAS
ncbi:uncharacterized protein V1510DRAFT_420117 [Dipodascopsis tothii]|uniref:uncharacterized protein n=1 Tax=Dipodascopsis tothii TaxID=44089 RepID=UPI0034CE07D4